MRTRLPEAPYEIVGQREFDAAMEQTDSLIVQRAGVLNLPSDMVDAAKERIACRLLAKAAPVTEVIQ